MWIWIIGSFVLGVIVGVCLVYFLANEITLPW